MLKSNLSRRRGTALNSSNPPSIFRPLQQKNASQVPNRGLQNSPNVGTNQVRRPFQSANSLTLQALPVLVNDNLGEHPANSALEAVSREYPLR
jgi:hypothetical protein